MTKNPQPENLQGNLQFTQQYCKKKRRVSRAIFRARKYIYMHIMYYMHSKNGQRSTPMRGPPGVAYLPTTLRGGDRTPTLLPVLHTVVCKHKPSEHHKPLAARYVLPLSVSRPRDKHCKRSFRRVQCAYSSVCSSARRDPAIAVEDIAPPLEGTLLYMRKLRTYACMYQGLFYLSAGVVLRDVFTYLCVFRIST